jgi:hypothetical protein
LAGFDQVFQANRQCHQLGNVGHARRSRRLGWFWRADFLMAVPSAGDLKFGLEVGREESMR